MSRFRDRPFEPVPFRTGPAVTRAGGGLPGRRTGLLALARMAGAGDNRKG
jgi:hypothetical protein